MVSNYLARLHAAAADLPPGRREELVAEIRGHIDEALATSGGGDVEVRQVLDRLGAPEDIVAAERADAEGHQPPTVGTAPLAPPEARRSPWGVVEVLAVLGLTLGAFVLPLLGPLVGAALAWGSSRWTRGEKWIATVLAVVPILVLALGAAVVVTVGPSGLDEPVPVEPVPSVSAAADPSEG